MLEAGVIYYGNTWAYPCFYMFKTGLTKFYRILQDYYKQPNIQYIQGPLNRKDSISIKDGDIFWFVAHHTPCRSVVRLWMISSVKPKTAREMLIPSLWQRPGMCGRRCFWPIRSPSSQKEFRPVADGSGVLTKLF